MLKRVKIVLTACLLQTCCHKFLSSFFRTGLTRKSAAPLIMHLYTVLTESCEDITAPEGSKSQLMYTSNLTQIKINGIVVQEGHVLLITGILLQISCSIIKVRRANPEIAGRSTSVNMRSMLWGLPFRTSHAFKPSGIAITDQIKWIKISVLESIFF